MLTAREARRPVEPARRGPSRRGGEEVRLALATESPTELPRAAAVLGPLNAGRCGDALVFTVRRAGGPAGPEAARRLFRASTRSRIWSSLELHRRSRRPRMLPARAPRSRRVAAVLGLPPSRRCPADWSDLLCELELDSSDLLPRAALLCAPLNPTRDPGKHRLRLPLRAARGLRRLAGHGAPLLRALRRARA